MLSLTTALFLLLAPLVGHGPDPHVGPGAAPARAPLPDAPSLGSSRLEEAQLQSVGLAHRERYRVYLPPGYDRSTRTYPMIVVLHGLGGEGLDWFAPKDGDLRRQLDQAIAEGRLAPVVAIAPDGHDGYWTDHVSHEPGTGYGTFIGEVIDDALQRYRVRGDSMAIVGASMGGHGAMSYGLMHPDRFRAIVSIAGALFAEPPTHRKIYKRVWGDPADRDWFAKTAPMPLIRAWPAGKRLPALWLGYGSDDKDRFLDWNLGADKLLSDKKIPHVFRLAQGGHGWTTWRSIGPEWIAWLDPLLR